MKQSFVSFFMTSLENLFNSLNAKVAIKRNQSIDLLCKLVDWCLYNGNFGVKWVQIHTVMTQLHNSKCIKMFIRVRHSTLCVILNKVKNLRRTLFSTAPHFHLKGPFFWCEIKEINSDFIANVGIILNTNSSSASNYTKSVTLLASWVFFTLFKLYKWH